MVLEGENVDSLVNATQILQSDEKLDGYMIFKSNQGTGDHLKNELNSKTMKPYASGTLTGVVSNTPKIVKGGHVFFQLILKIMNFGVQCIKNRDVKNCI